MGLWRVTEQWVWGETAELFVVATSPEAAKRAWESHYGDEVLDYERLVAEYVGPAGDAVEFS